MTTTAPEGGNVIQLRWHPVLTLPERLRMVRKDHGARMGSPKITQVQFATELGVNPNTYKQWEAGHAKPLDLVAFAKRVYEVTSCDPAWLLDVMSPDGPKVPPGLGVSDRACNGENIDFGTRASRPLAVAA